MTKILHRFLGLFFTACALTLLGCDSQIATTLFAKNPVQVSGSLQIGPAAKKIVLEPPLVARFTHQKLLLVVPSQQFEGLKVSDSGSAEPEATFADGRKTKIQVTLIDDRGQEYALRLNYSSGGLAMHKNQPPRKFSDPPSTVPDFPPDRPFKQMIIRSDLPIALDRIEWVGNNPQ